MYTLGHLDARGLSHRHGGLYAPAQLRRERHGGELWLNNFALWFPKFSLSPAVAIAIACYCSYSSSSRTEYKSKLHTVFSSKLIADHLFHVAYYYFEKRLLNFEWNDCDDQTCTCELWVVDGVVVEWISTSTWLSWNHSTTTTSQQQAEKQEIKCPAAATIRRNTTCLFSFPSLLLLPALSTIFSGFTRIEGIKW